MNARIGFRLRGVCVTTQGRHRLHGIDLDLERGWIALLGESGAGKTTLLDVLAGFESPSRGRIERPVTREGVLPYYWVPASGGLWPQATVREHLERVAPARSDPAQRSALLEQLELAPLAARRPHQLSDGQRARLALGRALASGAGALLMDEPLAHLDAALRERSLELLRRAVEQGTLLVSATHDSAEALQQADRALVLHAGALAFEGPIQTLYDRAPTPDLARALGPVNWLEAAERRELLGCESGEPCLRPERLALDASIEGPIVLVQREDRGPFCHCRVRSAVRGDEHALVLLRSAVCAAVGSRAFLRVIAALLLLVSMLGCGGDREPHLVFRSMRSVSLPPEGPKTPAPRGLGRMRNGDLLVLDTLGRVLRFDPAGACVARWWMPEYSVGRPEGVLELEDGRIAVADTHYHRVVFFDAEGTVLSTLGEEGTGPGQFLYPVKLVQDRSGRLYVAEYGSNDRIQVFAADGRFERAFGSFGTELGQFQRIGGMVWCEGRLYVADAVNHRIQVFTDDGEFLELLGGEHPVSLAFPYDLCLDEERRLVTVEYDGNRVAVLERDGRLVGRFGAPGRDLGQFSTPWGVRAMPGGSLWVADTGNRRLVELLP